MSEKKKSIEIFNADCELVRISKYSARYRVTAEKGSVPVDLANIEITRGFLPDDSDFNMGFINADLEAEDEKTLKKMQAKQNEFRKFIHLKMVITKES